MGERRAAGTDEGQVAVLLVGLVVVALALVSVVAATSAVFLGRRALSAAADGAAVAAASAVDEEVVYGGGLDRRLPLAEDAVAAAVGRYVVGAQLGRRFEGLGVSSGTDGATATVTLRAVVPVPVLNAVTDAFGPGVPIEVTAHATAPVGP